MILIKLIFEDLKTINKNKFSIAFNFFLCNTFHIAFWYRISNWLYRHKLSFLSRIISSFCRIIYSCDIAPEAIIGRRMLIVHGFDIVIGPNVTIGDDLKIFNGVTLGNRKGQHTDGQPKLGNNCMLGTGAKILGNINLGNNVQVGANAVVLNSVPDNCTAIGIPAKILHNEYRNDSKNL